MADSLGSTEQSLPGNEVVTTIIPLDVRIGVATNIIDRCLGDVIHRELVASGEVVNFLFDTRNALVGIGKEFSTYLQQGAEQDSADVSQLTVFHS